MNEIDWLTGTEPGTMLDYLEGKVSDRKLRLFACACARRYWSLLRWPRSRTAIEVAERFAESQASAAELEEARQGGDLSAANAPHYERFAYFAAAATTAEAAIEAARNARENGRLMAVSEAVEAVTPLEDFQEIVREASATEGRAQCDLLREVVGNLYRPTHVKRLWLDWGNGAVSVMARLIYDGCQYEDLPYLADALLDAGCDDENLLRHLRTPGAHVRGCWALDCLLAKE
jgi:hypothetical protein